MDEQTNETGIRPDARREDEHRPCLEGLVNSFIIDFNTPADLCNRIEESWNVMDIEKTGRLSREDITEGLQRLNLTPQVHIDLADWLFITEQGRLCDSDATLDRDAWHGICRSQLRLYVLQELSDSLHSHIGGASGSDLSSILKALKVMVAFPLEGCASQRDVSKEAPVYDACASDNSPRQEDISARLSRIEGSLASIQRVLAGGGQGDEARPAILPRRHVAAKGSEQTTGPKKSAGASVQVDKQGTPSLGEDSGWGRRQEGEKQKTGFQEQLRVRDGDLQQVEAVQETMAELGEPKICAAEARVPRGEMRGKARQQAAGSGSDNGNAVVKIHGNDARMSSSKATASIVASTASSRSLERVLYVHSRDRAWLKPLNP